MQPPLANSLAFLPMMAAPWRASAPWFVRSAISSADRCVAHLPTSGGGVERLVQCGIRGHACHAGLSMERRRDLKRPVPETRRRFARRLVRERTRQGGVGVRRRGRQLRIAPRSRHRPMASCTTRLANSTGFAAHGATRSAAWARSARRCWRKRWPWVLMSRPSPKLTEVMVERWPRCRRRAGGWQDVPRSRNRRQCRAETPLP